MNAVVPWHNSLADTKCLRAVTHKSLLAERFCGTKALWYYMAMANLPATTSQNAETPAETRLLDALSEALHTGKRPAEIARHLAPNDPVRRKYWRDKIDRTLKHDDRLALRLAGNARVEHLLGIGPASRSLARKARAGRVDAIKLLFEVSGLHNPRVSHEHSGEVNIKVTMPRPDFKSTQAQEPVVDADVVDDS